MSTCPLKLAEQTTSGVNFHSLNQEKGRRTTARGALIEGHPNYT